jgi:hypothetical protein
MTSNPCPCCGKLALEKASWTIQYRNANIKSRRVCTRPKRPIEEDEETGQG